MPRKGVPYGGAICSLKERIAEIWDKLGEKLHSINGVEGDGAGDVKIVSGDAAVVINNDRIGHKIEVGLNKSKLPSAMVTSVNGESGPVFLTARDITSDGHSNVQDDIDSSRTSITTLAGNIIIERQMRQKTDAALQTNINRVQASMSEAAAHAVSNNPTVARLATDVPNKVDKITGGSIKRAYTHTGSVQDDTPAVNGTDANSIGLRDANGRMQAADPASGATDKTLVTANWVSQTGDGAPNNLIHKTGNETKIGTFQATALMANQTVRAANSIVIKDSYLSSNTSIPTETNDADIGVVAGDNSEIMNFIVRTTTDGWRILRIGLHDTATGNNHLFNLMAISPDGSTVIYPWS